MTLYPGVIPIDQGNRKASAHRDWLEAMRQTVHDLQFLLWAIHGGADGVLGLGVTATDSLKVAPTTPASMGVDVLPGAALAYETAFRLAAAQRLTFMAPEVETRIDLIQVNLATQAIEVKVGLEGEGEAEPEPDGTAVPLAALEIPVGATSITADGSGGSGKILDRRAFVNI